MVAILRHLRRKYCRNFRPAQHQRAARANTRRNLTPTLFSVCLTAAALFLLAAAPMPQQSPPPAQRIARGIQEQLPTFEPEPVSPLSPKQKQMLVKANFEKMKKDADDLAALAKSLQEEIEGSNQNVLSLRVVDKAEKIEKLAKKIRTAAKGE
jgi:hypothetical protein